MFIVSAVHAQETAAPKCVISVDRDFAEFDHVVDGKITLQEMYDLPIFVEATDAERQELKDVRYQMFHTMDKNGDDQVTKDELREYEIKHLPNCVIE